MTKLLIDEPPLQVLPSLAILIGLNEAIILQQIHYWLKTPNVGRIVDGRKWIFNSVRQWKETNFPFWSEATIRRAITNLIKAGIIETRSDLNKKGFDKTLWYAINYESVTKPFSQNDQTIRSNCTNGLGQNDQTNTREYTETTTENAPPDFLETVVTAQGNLDPSQVEPSDLDRHFGRHRETILEVYQSVFGRHPNPGHKDALIEFSQDPKFSPKIFRKFLPEYNEAGGYPYDIARIKTEYLYFSQHSKLPSPKSRFQEDPSVSLKVSQLTPEQLEVYKKIEEEN